MYSERENFIRTIENRNPDRLSNDYDALFFCPDPIFMLDRTGVVPGGKPGERFNDTWGTTVVHPEGDPGPMPIVNDQTKVLRDITKWKEQVKIPDYSAWAKKVDWTDVKGAYQSADHEKQFTMTLMIVGLFERLHYLMGFEDALMNMIEEPEAVHELLDAILEARIEQAKVIIDNASPEVIIHHDDWGSKTRLFISPDLWREFFKERYRKLYDYIQSRGVILIHHADSFCAPIAKDMAEIGIKCWQGALPENDIAAVQKEVKGKMSIMGGITATIDKPNWNESEVRAEVRRACKEYGPNGSFIPCLTYGGPGSIYPGVSDVIRDEINKYNKEVYKI